MRNHFYILTLLGLVLAGCHGKGPPLNPYTPRAATTGVTFTNQLPDELRKAAPEPFRLGPGDKLDLELIGDITTKTAVTVGADGKIYFYLLPGLDVWGLTVPETKSLIQRELGKFIRDEAQVGITLREVHSRRVWLLGRFTTPGVYPMPGNMTLLEAFGVAGGPASLGGNQQSNFAYTSEELADFRKAFVIRQGKRLPVDFQRLLKEGDLTQNIYLEPDDFVYLPPAGAREVYVLGAVAQPRAVTWNDEMTVVAAIANAFGTIQDAYVHQVALVRGSLSNPQIAIVDYRHMIEGKVENIHVEAGDIVYVPFSPYRYLGRYLNLILDTFVSTVAINEGARAAVEDDDAPPGIFIPLGSGVTVTPPPVTPRQ
jgi:polysaccharide export outer membrane protein